MEAGGHYHNSMNFRQLNLLNSTIVVKSSYYYLVIDPDNSANREVVLVTSSSGTTISAMTRDLEGRHTTDPDHQAGTTVRMAVLAEHFVDMNDRLDTGLASLTNAIQTSDLQYFTICADVTWNRHF